MTGSWKGRGNQYIQLVKVLDYELAINGKQLPALQHQFRAGFELKSQRWEARVLPLRRRGPSNIYKKVSGNLKHLNFLFEISLPFLHGFYVCCACHNA